MRVSLAVVLLAVLVGGCMPAIPVRDSFGTSALVPAGDTPPEFAEFNAYDASVNPLLAEQICATPYRRLEEKSVEAVPGSIVQARGRCETHRPLVGQSLGLFSPR